MIKEIDKILEQNRDLLDNLFFSMYENNGVLEFSDGEYLESRLNKQQCIKLSSMLGEISKHLPETKDIKGMDQSNLILKIKNDMKEMSPRNHYSYINFDLLISDGKTFRIVYLKDEKVYCFQNNTYINTEDLIKVIYEKINDLTIVDIIY